MKSHWPGVGHMLITEPITVLRGMANTDWPGLCHVLLSGGVNPTKPVWSVKEKKPSLMSS